MRLVAENHDPVSMKRLSDFDRMLNLLGELNDNFPYSGIMQLEQTGNGALSMTASSNLAYFRSHKNAFESRVASVWELCFGKPNISFFYDNGGYSSIRQEGSGC